MRILTDAQTRDALQDHALDRPRGVGFAFRDPAAPVFYGWHAHAYHQLLFARTGTTQLETAQARFLLPPRRAAWIPAGLEHRTLISDADGVSLSAFAKAFADLTGETPSAYRRRAAP